MLKRALCLIAVFLSLGASARADAFCGNKIIDPGEQCDDGNFYNGDGCNSYCQLEDITPPSVTSISIPDKTTGVPTTTTRFTIQFNEPLDPASVTKSTVYLEQNAQPFEGTLTLDNSKTTVILKINQDLVPNMRHAFHIKGVKDVAGNPISTEIISIFTTGDYIDHTPPNVIAVPPGGSYSYTQEVTLKPFLDAYTGSDDFLDLTAKVYYTIDGTNPSTSSPVFSKPFTIKTNTTIRFFGIDAKGNTSTIKTEVYNFACGEIANVFKMQPYPSCKIVECNPGYQLQGGICVLNTTVSADDLSQAVTAPLFPSDTPISVLSKPAILLTQQHRGMILRPLNFIDSKLGTQLSFQRDTKITNPDGSPFQGYLKRPENLFSKDFPINFGFTFKSIIKFDPVGHDLSFSPPYKLTIPYNATVDPTAEVTIFTYNPATETYTTYPLEKVINEPDKKQVSVLADKNNIFFLAQNGKDFNEAVFQDAQGHWAQNYIEALYRKGIVKGKAPKLFAPNDPLTRAEFIKIALLSANVAIPNPDSVQFPPFEDVPLYSWYFPYIAKAKDLGITKGYPDGTFKPDSPINRAEAIKILMGAFGFALDVPKDESAAYKDILSDQWYFPAINFAIHYKLLDGLRKESDLPLPDWFGPDQPITRGEMAKLAMKSIELKDTLAKAKKK